MVITATFENLWSGRRRRLPAWLQQVLGDTAAMGRIMDATRDSTLRAALVWVDFSGAGVSFSIAGFTDFFDIAAVKSRSLQLS